MSLTAKEIATAWVNKPRTPERAKKVLRHAPTAPEIAAVLAEITDPEVREELRGWLEGKS